MLACVRCLTFLLLLFVSFFSAAQFVIADEEYPVYIGGENGMYGNGLSVYDFNYDGLEDLTCCTRNDGVRTFERTASGYQEVWFLPFIEGDIKHALWVDFDNDDDADFFVTIAGGSCRLFRHDAFFQFTDITASLPLPDYAAISFGASWGDYDRDGLLDLYVCNYEYNNENPQHNWLLHQFTPGQFEEVSEELGVDNGFRATFQSVWTDINLDGLPDLYVINDRLHSNAIYVQNDGVFSDMSEILELDLELESMSNSWADFDGDLDLDVYITNSDEGNKLMRNDGSHFSDISASSQTEVNSICWSAIWMDYDHNGKMDLHVATSADYYLDNYNALLTNQGQEIFSQSFIQGDNATVLCEVQSDFNNDGFWDIIQLEQFPVGIHFFRNEGSENHWFKFGLRGIASNREGIGARVYAYINGDVRMTMKFCGESFLVQRSQYETVSMKESTWIDSLQVVWPSGWVDRYYNLSAETFQIFTEGETIEDLESHYTLCPGSAIDISAQEGSDYHWSAGDTTASIHITAPGLYTVEYRNAFSLTVHETHIVEAKNSPNLDWQISEPTCFGMADGIVTLETEELVWITQFSQGDLSGNDLINIGAGLLSVTITDSLSCLWTDEIVVHQPEALQVEFASLLVCPDEQMEFIPTIIGGASPCSYSIDETSFAWVGVGEHTLRVTDANGCFLDTLFYVEEHFPVEIEIVLNENCPGYPASAIIAMDGGEGIVEWYCDANSLDALTPGIYTVYANDAAGCYYEESFVVAENPEPVFETSLEYNAESDCFRIALTSVDPENYLFEWSNGSTGAVLECVEGGSYHCAIEDLNGCEFFIEVLVTETQFHDASGEILLYPNPCADACIIRGAAHKSFRLFSADGDIIREGLITDEYYRLNLQHLKQGLYLMQVEGSTFRFVLER